MAAIRIFEASGNPKDIPKYMDIHRLFRRGKTALCKASLAANGSMTSRHNLEEGPSAYTNHRMYG
jgi:hypothetical protein